MAEVDPKGHPPRAVLGVISPGQERSLRTRGGWPAAPENYFEETAARVYHHYEEIMARNNAVDFDDLLMKSAQLLEEYRFVREHYQERYVHVMVDEFQDTNVAQYRLARLLAGERRNICVVGDPDQSIYSWRSADIRNILSFQRDYPGCKTISLEQNYRSTSNILDAAQSVISNNRQRLEKGLFTENGGGVPVYAHETYNEEDEAGYVIGEADRLVREKRAKAGDCAIMYRVNAQSRALEEACLRRGMKVPAGGRRAVLPAEGGQGPAGVPASGPQPAGRCEPDAGYQRAAAGNRGQVGVPADGLGQGRGAFPPSPPCNASWGPGARGNPAP